MLLGSYSGMSAWDQKSIDRLLEVNKNKNACCFEWNPIILVFVQLDVSGEDLSNLDLSGLEFQSCNFADANCEGTNFEDTGFCAVNCKGTNFDYANLNDVRFCDVNPTVRNLYKQNASNEVTVYTADLTGASFNGTDRTNMQYSITNAPILILKTEAENLISIDGKTLVREVKNI